MKVATYFELPSGLRVSVAGREPRRAFDVSDGRGGLVTFTEEDVKSLPYTAGALYAADQQDRNAATSHGCMLPVDAAGVLVWRCPVCRAVWDHHDYPAPNGGVTPHHWAKRDPRHEPPV